MIGHTQLAIFGKPTALKTDREWAIETIKAQSHETLPFTVASISGGQ
jgi:hypothetical protein